VHKQWQFLTWTVPSAIVVLVVVVLVAVWLRSMPAAEAFVTTYPGTTPLPEGAPVGIPAWLGWQHFLNFFFLVLIVRTAWSIRSKKRPDAFWVRDNTGIIRTKAAPRRIGINVWLHLVVDALWVLNGVVLWVLLFATGQWIRIVPTSWDIFPNAVSALLQYATFDWPTDNGWVNYNSLQVLAYFATVFVAAPVALATGLRLSSAWPLNAPRWNRIFPESPIRWAHNAVLFYFVGFTIVHVTLVMTTGALRNLNHMFAGNDGTSWVGAGVFAASLLIVVAGWIILRPSVVRWLAAMSGSVRR
jgi:thiosulfate reductase cytochrome b subunit